MLKADWDIERPQMVADLLSRNAAPCRWKLGALGSTTLRLVPLTPQPSWRSSAREHPCSSAYW
jgi:hypothetical protein